MDTERSAPRRSRSQEGTRSRPGEGSRAGDHSVVYVGPQTRADSISSSKGQPRRQSDNTGFFSSFSSKFGSFTGSDDAAQKKIDAAL